MKRFKVFDWPHRGIRNALAQLLLHTGKTDFRNQQEIAHLQRLSEEVFRLLALHAADEDDVILAALEEKLLGASGQNAATHQKIEKLQSELESQLQEIVARTAAGEVTTEKGIIFYWTLNEFYAAYLLHMLEEEIEIQEMLWQYFNDSELVTLRNQVITRMNPQNLLCWLKYMMPSLNLMERIDLLRWLAATMPLGFFMQAILIVEGVLSTCEWQVLESELLVTPGVSVSL